jgi:1-acyl-sn-glycerol-3-phosphate acyltransferase
METITRWVQRKWFYDLAVVVVGFLLKAIYGFKVYGQEHVPQDGGLVVASNHITWVDPPLMGVSVPREVNYMAKRELFEKNRLFRALILGLRSFPVDRERSDMSAIKEALRRLERGVAIGIFVQGTRNQGDAKALDGAAFLAQRAGVPVVPAAIWRDGRAFRVRFGEPLYPKGKSREEARELTGLIMARINGLLPAASAKLTAPEPGEPVHGR